MILIKDEKWLEIIKTKNKKKERKFELYRTKNLEQVEESDMLNNQGIDFAIMGNHSLALEYFEKAVKKYAKNYNAWKNIGKTYGSIYSNHKKAASAYKKALSIFDYEFMTWACLAESYLKNKEYDNAIRIYKIALKFGEDSKIILRHIGDIYLIQHRYELALDYYLKILEIGPSEESDYLIYLNMSVIYGRIDDNVNVLKYLKMALELKPDDPEVHYSFGVYYRDKDFNIKESIRYFKKALEIEPSHANSLINLVGLLIFVGDLEEASILGTKAIELYPENHFLLNNLGCLYEALKDYETALSYLHKSIEYNPNYSEPYYNIATIYFEQEKIEECMNVLRNGLKVNPSSVRILNLIGLIYARKRRFKLAERYYKKAIETSSDDPIMYYNLGVLYQTQSKFKEAIEFYDKTTSLYSNYIDAYNNRGVCYNSLGDEENALLNYNKALEIDANYYPSYINIGNILLSKDELIKARNMYKEGYELSSEQLVSDYFKQLLDKANGRILIKEVKEKDFTDKELKEKINDIIDTKNQLLYYDILKEYQKIKREKKDLEKRFGMLKKQLPSPEDYMKTYELFDLNTKIPEESPISKSKKKIRIIIFIITSIIGLDLTGNILAGIIGEWIKLLSSCGLIINICVLVAIFIVSVILFIWSQQSE